jgi:predicted aspartyl protease
VPVAWSTGASTIATLPVAVPAPLAADVIYARSTTLDEAGRVLAPVMVNGQGPFRFILDTGANRSVLSPRVAALLELTPSHTTSINVHGVTGSAVLPAVDIRELRAGPLTVVRDKRMPVLPESVLADADGILGIEGLAGMRIDVDFASGTVTITRSRGAPAEEGMLVVPARLRHGGLLVADARFGRVRVKAIIDTGAERTLGNAALQEALALRPSLLEGYAVTTVHGATPTPGEGTSLRGPTIYLGEAELANLEVTFGDLHVFKIWGLEDTPALLIGMDLLGSVQRLVIDYKRSEVQVLPWPKVRDARR